MSKKLFGKITAFICAASVMTGIFGVTTFADTEPQEEIAENSAIEVVSDNDANESDVIDIEVSENNIVDAAEYSIDSVESASIDSTDSEPVIVKLNSRKNAWMIPIKADFSKKSQGTFDVIFNAKSYDKTKTDLMCFFRQAGKDEEDTCDVSNRWDAYSKNREFNDDGSSTITYHFRFSEAQNIKNEDAELVFRYSAHNSKVLPAPDVNSFKIVYKDETVTAKDWAEKNKNTLENYMTATEPIEVREGYWIMPVDITDLMMNSEYGISLNRKNNANDKQKIKWYGIQIYDFYHKDTVNDDPKFAESRRLSKPTSFRRVREVLTDSLDWKKAQLIIRYDVDSSSYEGQKPNIDDFYILWDVEHEYGGPYYYGTFKNTDYPKGNMDNYKNIDTEYPYTYIPLSMLRRNPD